MLRVRPILRLWHRTLTAAAVTLMRGVAFPLGLVPLRPGDVASADGCETECNAKIICDAKPLGDGVGLELDRAGDGVLGHAPGVGFR